MTRTGRRVSTMVVLVALTAGAWCVAPGSVSIAAARKHAPGPPSISYSWRGVPTGERVIEVYGLNGNIRATHSENETLYVEAVKRGQKDDPDEVQIETDTTAQGVRICARYPRPSGALNDCGPNQDVRKNDVLVDFTLHVPPGAKLVARTVNGSIGGEEMEGPVEASTVEGGITVVSTHRVIASTVDGSIDVMMGTLGWSEPMSYTTTNGSVLLRVPGFADGVIDARTTTGHVECSLALASTEKRDRQHLVGTLGKGGPRLRIETVNGNVEVMTP